MWYDTRKSVIISKTQHDFCESSKSLLNLFTSTYLSDFAWLDDEAKWKKQEFLKHTKTRSRIWNKNERTDECAWDQDMWKKPSIHKMWTRIWCLSNNNLNKPYPPKRLQLCHEELQIEKPNRTFVVFRKESLFMIYWRRHWPSFVDLWIMDYWL